MQNTLFAFTTISFLLLGTACHEQDDDFTGTYLGVATGSGQSTDSKAPNDFSAIELEVQSISVNSGGVWQLNRPIDIRFSQAIDFSTVSSATLQIASVNTGIAATGSFFQPVDAAGRPQARMLRFQPTCPLESDYSDGGLLPFETYQLRVAGLDGVPANMTIRSTSGGEIQQSTTVVFTTPNSTDPLVLFFDTVPTPPAVLARGIGTTSLFETEATYLEIGGDGANREYFENGTLGSFLVPLNKYSDPLSQVSTVLYFDQAIAATAANLSQDRIQYEYFDGQTSMWVGMPTSSTLVENCSSTGAAVRVDPLGLLPQGSDVRLSVRQGFADITGQASAFNQVGFAQMTTQTVLDAGGNPADDADEYLESFILGGDTPGSLEDTDSDLAEPRADWGSGSLAASLNFDGSGGPGGNFDFHVPAGQVMVINTIFDTIVGGPGGVPTTTQDVVNGVIDVRDLYIGPGARLFFVGPNPVTILASGNVAIEGRMSVDGTNTFGVGTLNTTSQPEMGATGNAGGGRGGVGSFLTSSSTPRGGPGFGAFQSVALGGQGGETSYSPNTPQDARRGAGGGGGTLGRDIYYDHDDDSMTELRQCQTLLGMDGEPGFSGAALGTGAVSQSVRAEGGAQGPSPFVDADPMNDFFGDMVTANGVSVQGELSGVIAGAGGGAGGDASRTATFPQVPFQPTGDEKGSGGGGGAGGLQIFALGSIVVEDGGEITANGGHGGGGENTLFFDRVGGASGGGSGGHVVLSSANFIEVRGAAMGAGPGYRDFSQGNKSRPISALGGQGGAGHDNRGGADETGPTVWRCDAIPLDRLMGIGGASDVPPLLNASTCFGPVGMPDWNDSEGPVLGAGGDGSPGIVQLHAPDPDANLRFPGSGPGVTWAGGDITPSFAPTPVGWNGPAGQNDTLDPFQNSQSVGQSQWIPLGLARVAPGANPDDQVEFFFGGTDPATGSVLRDPLTGNMVEPIADLIPGAVLQASGTVPYVESGGLAIFLDAANLPNAYRINPRLLIGFSIVLEDSLGSETFAVQSARVWPGDRLRLMVAAEDNLLDNFVNTATGPVTASLRQHFFRMVTEGMQDAFPVGTDVKILFDAAELDMNGNPNEATSFSAVNGGPATDITDLNGQNWDVFRFRVLFNLDADGTGINSNVMLPSLDFLRMPFVY